MLGAQQLIETLYQLVSGNDAETLRILDDVIILFVHANPDGMTSSPTGTCASRDPTKRTLAGLPRLYQKYIGHDNNRDFYANTQAETQNMNRVLYREWFPQIVYNHHQTGPPGTVLFCPPFRDPFNYNFDPLVVSGIDLVGAAMHAALPRRGQARRDHALAARTTRPGGTAACARPAYFHNMIGLLTETIGNPTPMRDPVRAAAAAAERRSTAARSRRRRGTSGSRSITR